MIVLCYFFLNRSMGEVWNFICFLATCLACGSSRARIKSTEFKAPLPLEGGSYTLSKIKTAQGVPVVA